MHGGSQSKVDVFVENVSHNAEVSGFEEITRPRLPDLSTLPISAKTQESFL